MEDFVLLDGCHISAWLTHHWIGWLSPYFSSAVDSSSWYFSIFAKAQAPLLRKYKPQSLMGWALIVPYPLYFLHYYSLGTSELEGWTPVKGMILHHLYSSLRHCHWLIDLPLHAGSLPRDTDITRLSGYILSQHYPRFVLSYHHPIPWLFSDDTSLHMTSVA